MRHKVRGINIYLLIYFLICSVNILPQETAQTDSSKETYNHAIQFYIVNQLIGAYKYHISEPSAFRITINVTGLFETGKQTSYADDTVQYDMQYADTKHFTEVKFQYLYNIKVNNIIGVFLGAGPLFNYAFSLNEGRFSTIEKTWNLGISTLAGLECVVYKNIGLFAEYEAALTWGKRKIDVNNGYENYEFDLSGSEFPGVRVGVSISF
jgi:opacity protein-like surface antigen